MASRFWVGGTGTWDASDTTHWAAGSGGGGGQSVPGSGDTVTFDNLSGGGTVTPNTTINVTSITFGAFTGTLAFNTNNNNVTVQTLSGTGSGTRTLDMGSGTWTYTGTGTVMAFNTMTNLTLTASNATHTFTATTTTARIIQFGSAASLGTVNIGANTSGGVFNPITANGTTLTIATLNITAPNDINFAGNGRTYAITNAMTVTGSSSNPVLFTFDPGFTNQATISSANNMTLSWCAIWYLAFAGGGNVTATNSLNLGNNTISGGGSLSITAPSTGGSAGVIGS